MGTTIHNDGMRERSSIAHWTLCLSIFDFTLKYVPDTKRMDTKNNRRMIEVAVEGLETVLVVRNLRDDKCYELIP